MRRGLVSILAPGLLLLPLAGPATATPYETFIDVTDQGDLEDLLAAGDITADTFEELLELLGSGVDLDTADRAQLYALPNLTYDDVDGIIAYREKNKGTIKDPAALVNAGALSENKLLSISAFLVLNQARDKYGVKGWARIMTRMSSGDSGPPPFALRGRFGAFKHLQAGFAATFTRLEVGSPQYDPSRDALIADNAGKRVVVPKVFVKYEDDEATLIGGTFRAGFGQRLVFDNSSRYSANGLYFDDDLTFTNDLVTRCKESIGELPANAPPCSDKEEAEHVTPDWKWRDGLFGVGAGFKKLEVGTGWLQGYVWASARKRRVYQYELVDRSKDVTTGLRKCEDPSVDDDPDCAAPPVFVRPDGDPLQSTSKFKFVTLPDVFQERLAGANFAYFADRRSSVGITAYSATESNLVNGVDLDTQEWSSFPTGRRFAAGGANFSFGRGWLDIFGEVAFSYDHMPDTFGPQKGGGGPAAILRLTATKKKEELEAVFRYYGIDYVNPYARPISQPDTLDGQRARDELGFRLKYYRTDKLFSLRALVDIWEPPSQTDDTQLGRHQPKLDMYVRGDVRTTNELKLGLWLRYQDKDLKAGGNGQCFEISTEFDENGEPIPCGGRQLTTIARAAYQQSRKLSFTAMLEHQLLDDPSIVDGCDVTTPGPCKFRQDMSGWLIALFNPQPDVRLRARVRYLDEDISATDSLETSLSALVEASFKVRKRDIIKIRGDAKWFLDDRASTQGDDNTAPRSPNPELQLWLSYEAKL
ncbi:MAG: hypothetical protein ABI867_02485 [Kofleriaceae bacterium]